MSSEEQPNSSSYKEQLDHRARVARDPNYGKEEPQPTLLEKGNTETSVYSFSRPFAPFTYLGIQSSTMYLLRASS
jgi:hypothetical protein